MGTRLLATYRDQQRLAGLGRSAERQRLEAESRRLGEQAAEYGSNANALHDQIRLQAQRIANTEARLHNMGTLRARGYVSDISYQAQQELVLSLRQEMAALHQRNDEAIHKLRQTRLEIAALASQSRLAELQSASLLAELERGATREQLAAEETLLAPIAGRVSALRATPGMVVAGSEEVASIVRPGDPLEVLLFVPTAAAGSLYLGQDVSLQYDAFPYPWHGVGHGIVIRIAMTASPERPRASPTYRVTVRLLDADRFALRPDMTLSANITIERRSALDWLLAPVRERWREAGQRRPA